MNNKGKNILLGAVVLIIAILVIIFIVRGKSLSNPQTNNLPFPTPVSSYEKELQNNYGITIPSTAITANLKDATGGNQLGIATLDKSSGQSVYTVIANLENPDPGYFYQAWLVDPSGNTVSLGKLEIAKAGYLVNYTSNQDLGNYKTIWVTLEKYLDITPEKHVLEGSF